MVSGRFLPRRLPYIMHLANFQSQNPPTDFTNEPYD
jgi:hypothetical protein